MGEPNFRGCMYRGRIPRRILRAKSENRMAGASQGFCRFSAKSGACARDENYFLRCIFVSHNTPLR